MRTTVDNREAKIWIKHWNAPNPWSRQRRVTHCKVVDSKENVTIGEGFVTCGKKDQFVRRIGSMRAVHRTLRQMNLPRMEIKRIMNEWRNQNAVRK